jgi:aquaporin Z
MDDLTPSTAQKLSAEAIGAFVLVVLGVGAAINQSGDIAAIGLSFGIAIVAMVYAFGRVSGGHFNPAVSVGAALAGRISWKDAGLYSLAQVGGGIVGGLVLAIVYVSGDTGYSFGDDDLGANFFGDRGGLALGGALLVEIVLTALFLLVILAVTDERNEHPALAPLAIGLTLAAIHFVAIPLTGTSVNPARSISVALFSGGDAIVQLWLFILAPVIGAALAGAAYPALFGRVSEPVPGSGFSFTSAAAVPGYGQPDAFQQQWNQPGQGQQTGQPSGQQAGYGQGAYPQASYEQPIIQDGWQWDPQAQQWIPAQQQATPPPPQAQQAPQQGQGWQQPGDGPDNRTQIRP